jgi:2-polyprenyl-3-methyl-5-hydroxy-6-metoxy-1,4-benzoquinol methylase
MRNKSEIVRAQCERTAKEYYAFRKKGGTANDLVEIPAMKKLICDVSEKKVIDCGCGFGPYSIHCAKRGAIVTALDISNTMIKLAEQEAAEAEAQIDFSVQDVTNLSNFQINSFDIAISSNTVCFNISLFFREVSKILKPRGILYLCEVHPWINIKFGHYFKGGIRKAKNVFSKLNSSDPDYEWQWEHYTLQDYFSWLKEAGFLIDTFLEPKPDPSTKQMNPDLYNKAVKTPIFFLIKAIKGEVRA